MMSKFIEQLCFIIMNFLLHSSIRIKYVVFISCKLDLDDLSVLIEIKEMAAVRGRSVDHLKMKKKKQKKCIKKMSIDIKQVNFLFVTLSNRKMCTG